MRDPFQLNIRNNEPNYNEVELCAIPSVTSTLARSSSAFFKCVIILLLAHCGFDLVTQYDRSIEDIYCNLNHYFTQLSNYVFANGIFCSNGLIGQQIYLPKYLKKKRILLNVFRICKHHVLIKFISRKSNIRTRSLVNCMLTTIGKNGLIFIN